MTLNNAIRPKKVLITEENVRKTEEQAEKYAAKNIETGGVMVGRIGPNRVYEITDIIEAGPNPRRTAVSFSPDTEYVMQQMVDIKSKDPSKRYLGEWHLHPWHGEPYPSGIDLHQLQQSKKTRPWYFIKLRTLDGYKFWDLDEKEEDFVEVKGMVIPDAVSQESTLDRIREVTQSNILAEKRVTIIGLGSLGSVVTKYLGCTGIGELVLVDNEHLEAVNVIRHEGNIYDIGKTKTGICKQVIEAHNPFAAVEEINVDVLTEQDTMGDVIKSSDLVVSCSGNPKVNQLVNHLCVENKVPAVYSAIFAKASGGFSMVYTPGSACFNCLFDSVRDTHYVDKQQVLDYGLNADELHKQQGLWADVSLTAICAVKQSLAILQNQSIEHRLLRIYSSLDIRKADPVRREDCAVCNYEGWLAKQEQALNESESNTPKKTRRKSIKAIFGRKSR